MEHITGVHLRKPLRTAISKEDSLYLKNIIPLFAEALQTNNTATAKQIAESVSDYQKKFARYDLPSESKSKAEIFVL